VKRPEFLKSSFKPMQTCRAVEYRRFKEKTCFTFLAMLSKPRYSPKVLWLLY